MKKLAHFFLLTMIVVLGTACVSQTNISKNYEPMKPDVVRLNMTMADYVYMGDVTIEAEYKTYGLIKKILTINGETYDPRYQRTTGINFPKRFRMNGVMAKALYKVTDTYPEADYIIPASQSEVKEHMLGGAFRKNSITFKVFRLAQSSAANQMEEQAVRLAQCEQTQSGLQAERDNLLRELETTKQALAETEALLRAQGKSKRK